MKRWITILVLIQVLVLVFFNSSSANTAITNTFPKSIVTQQISESELATRFKNILDEELWPEENDFLDEELSRGEVVITPSAARELTNLMRSAAATVVQQRAFNRIREAEDNIRGFARSLLENGNRNSAGTIRITIDTINRTMRPPYKVMALGFCPLFPIC